MSSTPERPLQAEPFHQRAETSGKSLLKAIAYILAIVVIVEFGRLFLQAVDEHGGYIAHDRTLDVSMTGDWMVGENRICWLRLLYDRNENPTGQLSTLECPVGDERMETHNISVTFKGVVSPWDIDGKPRRVPDQWQCRRHDDGFTCVPMAQPSR